jgi:aminoglycoside 6-adenylyltransferase
MRSEKEVLAQLLSFAQSNEMVRAVILNGSRVNPNITKDIFCDYDVIYAVTDPEYFLHNRHWIQYFGDLIIMQQNDCTENGVIRYIFLMLFNDGIRIDLTFHPVEHIDIKLEDSLSVVLLDKDSIIKDLPLPNEISYFTQKPGQKEFDETVNEFWWCSTNIAKGLWRDELCYAKYMFEVIVRDCLIKMLSWYIGMNYNWSINSGIYGKWFKRYLPPELWESLEKTYTGTDYGEIWDALFEAGRLFRRIGTALADNLGYVYPIGDDQRVTVYLEIVRVLPKDAVSLFEV